MVWEETEELMENGDNLLGDEVKTIEKAHGCIIIIIILTLIRYLLRNTAVRVAFWLCDCVHNNSVNEL